MSAAQYMADVFRRHGVVQPERLSEALAQVDRSGTLLDALSRNGVDETPLSQALALELGLPFLDPLPRTGDMPVALLREVGFDFAFARQRQVIPVRDEPDGTLLVALGNVAQGASGTACFQVSVR